MTLWNTDEFGMRMKSYEAVETQRRLDPLLPIYARIDGRRFSRFTKGMQRPFDSAMTQAMIETTRYLVKETQARMGYTQSDEISLTWLGDRSDSEALFGGKVQKLVSILAAMATAKFARVCPAGFEDRLPHFDCRVFQLPSKMEASNAFLWRAMDARKNAIIMVAQSEFSHRELYQKDQRDMLMMLAEKGIRFEDQPVEFKRGSFLQRVTAERPLTPEERAKIPAKHLNDPPVLEAMVIRTDVKVIPMPPFNRVLNRVEVIFDGAKPRVGERAST